MQLLAVSPKLAPLCAPQGGHMSIRSLLALTALCAPLAAQTTYYVDASAIPPGSGTQADPYALIQSALDEPILGPGDTILVAPGTYVQPLSMVTTGGFRVVSTGGPLVTTITRAGKGPTIYINNNVWADETSFEGFTISGATGSQGYGFWAFSGTTRATNCILADNNYGLMGAGVTLSRSTVADNAIGVRLLYGAGVKVIDTAFSWNQYDIADSCFATSLWVENTVSGFPGPCAITINWIKGDAELWDPLGEDYHLKPGSPAIGAGTGGVDIGVMPFDPSYAPATPTNYCRSKKNSLGCKPRINFTGSPSITGGDFDVTCGQTLNNKLGLFFYGYQGKQVPYQGGKLCVVGPAKRTPVQGSGGNPPPDDCSGVYSFDFAAHMASGVDPTLVPGQSVFSQYWYRDPNDPTGFTTGRSNGLAFQILP